MIRMNVKINRNLITPALKSIRTQVNALPKDAYNYFVSITPIDTGNARRKTRFVNNKILASYAYAARLDKGWSKQARKGMVRPTRDWMRARIKQILRKRRYG
jgi:hypothetical protein